MTHVLSGKNVLVTGGAGFVGSHLVEKLLSLQAKVFVFDWKLKQPGYFSSNNLERQVISLYGDLRNFDLVKQAVIGSNIDYVYHIGAQALVSKALNSPLETFASNIMGTVHVLEASRLSPKVAGVFVASSDKAYGKDCIDATEEQKVFGDHPYDASKAATDIIAQTYFKTYGLPVVIARFGNIFGPGDVNFSRIIPGIMHAIINNQVLEIRSDGQFRRDYLYVKDVAEGYVKMAECLSSVKGEAFNFSSGLNFSVTGLVEKVSEILGSRCDYQILNHQQNEIPNQSLNFNKATQRLNWQANTPFDTAIIESYEWYKKNK